MKTVICYYSCHHGNTRKVVEAMAEEGGAVLVDLSTQPEAALEEYDLIGFASGIRTVFRSIHRWCNLPARGCPVESESSASIPMAWQRAWVQRKSPASRKRRGAA